MATLVENISKSNFQKTHTTLEHGLNLNVTKVVLLSLAPPLEINFVSALPSQITTILDM